MGGPARISYLRSSILGTTSRDHRWHTSQDDQARWSGKVTRQFNADLNGTWDGKQLILKEKFNWDDGEVQDREWTINKIDEHNYEGTAGDVVGKAKGYSYGPAFKFEYVLLVPVKGRELKITFDDWIFKQDDRVAINRATMTKFGFKVAELTVVFVKD